MLTGYSINDLKECLYELASFIATNLQPNRLDTFDIEAIRTVPLYQGFAPI